LKSVNIWLSYCEKQKGELFFETQCICIYLYIIQAYFISHLYSLFGCILSTLNKDVMMIMNFLDNFCTDFVSFVSRSNRKMRVPRLLVTVRVFCLLKTAPICAQTYLSFLGRKWFFYGKVAQSPPPHLTPRPLLIKVLHRVNPVTKWRATHRYRPSPDAKTYTVRLSSLTITLQSM